MDEKFVTLHLVVALEQDRHLLKRKLETVRSEYDIRITELQADIRELSRSLTERESVLKQSEKEKAALITELTEQNDRLTSQLKEITLVGLMIDAEVSLNMIDRLDSLVWHRRSCNMEEQLTNQIQILRDQCNEKKSSLQDHVNSIEILREEDLVAGRNNTCVVVRLSRLHCEDSRSLSRVGIAQATSCDEARPLVIRSRFQCASLLELINLSFHMECHRSAPHEHNLIAGLRIN
uniref:Uncharacterized protein n=1 Tax=Timema cristinae TaxID=61476 RepID=A0A7R9CUK7_TIMCR|nr:unnamed protein product [Timema cristinae]